VVALVCNIAMDSALSTLPKCEEHAEPQHSPVCLSAYLGEVSYGKAWDLQRRLADRRGEDLVPDTLLLLEHPHTFTLGRRGDSAHILLTPDELLRLGIEVFSIDRGGDVTYHGPGQLVGYPIMAVPEEGRDVIPYVRQLEAVIIRALGDFGIVASRLEGFSGVWLGNDKIAAIGVKVGRVTMHGFALNVNTDMTYFSYIIPCGLRDKGVTSMAAIIGHPVPMPAVCEAVVKHFGAVFERSIVMVDAEHLWQLAE
jgi:lipoyl(octanoyl) transferase